MSPSLSDLTTYDQICICGSVEIDPSAAIAPGVILRADPGCRLVIARRVCLGTGVVVRAFHGKLLVLQEGCSIGAGGLIVGSGQVGAYACVGAESTLIDPAVEAHQTIPPKSLVDRSRATRSQPARSHFSSTVPPQVGGTPTAPTADSNGSSTNGSSLVDESVPSLSSTNYVYGREAVQRLLGTLFPHRQLNSAAVSDSAAVFDNSS